MKNLMNYGTEDRETHICGKPGFVAALGDGDIQVDYYLDRTAGKLTRFDLEK